MEHSKKETRVESKSEKNGKFKGKQARKSGAARTKLKHHCEACNGQEPCPVVIKVKTGIATEKIEKPEKPNKGKGGKVRKAAEPAKPAIVEEAKPEQPVKQSPLVVVSDTAPPLQEAVRYRPHNSVDGWKSDPEMCVMMDAALARARAGGKVAIVSPTIAMNARYIDRMSKDTGLDLHGRKIMYQGSANLDEKSKMMAQTVNLVLTAPLKPAAVNDLKALGYELYTATVSSKYIANATVSGKNAAARRSNAFFERDACQQMRAQGAVVGALSATSDAMKDLYKAIHAAEKEVASQGERELFNLGADQEDPRDEAAGTEPSHESPPISAVETAPTEEGATVDSSGLELVE